MALILILFVLLGFTFTFVTPPFEASDELWHYPMVRHLAEGNPLPVQVFDPALAGPWNQEASQPPLYYYLGAALTFWIDQSDMEEVRWLNPHVDNGVITPDGNNNLAIHDPGSDPWSGSLLAIRIVRLFSVLLGVATVYLTYLIAAETVPGRPEIALGAAAINAFLPMFLFISGAVNNDNLAVPLASLALLLMIRIVTRRHIAHFSVRWWEWVSIGVVVGLAVLTKEGTLGLVPMSFGTAVVAAWQQLVDIKSSGTFPARQWRPVVLSLLSALALIVIPVVAIAGWWYYRNVVLYGDWLGWSAFIAVLGERGHPASLLQLWGERRGFMMSFWGLFGGVNIPMAMWVYSVLNKILILSVAGFIVQTFRLVIAEWRLLRTDNGEWLARLLGPVERNFGLIVNLVFSAAVIFGLIQWATTTWSSQGRLVFTAISSLSTLMAIGLAGAGDLLSALVRRLTTIRFPASKWLIVAVTMLLFLVAAASPWLWIRPAYQPPQSSGPLANTTDINFGGLMRVDGYEVKYDDLRPGDSLRVRLSWEVLTKMDRDWSVFIHLNDPVLGRPIVQRDMYPGAGLLATTLLKPGTRWVDEYVLAIPETAITPADLELSVGLYDFVTGERLKVSNDAEQAAPGDDDVVLQTIAMSAGDGPYPNPVSLFFEHGLELVGFSVEPRRVVAGEQINLVTYWRPSRTLPDDFTFFAQIVGEDTTRYAASDLTPVQPTSDWTIGEVFDLHFPLLVDPTTPPDAYPIIVGLYIRTADGGFDRLQQVAPDGRLTDDFLTLTLVKVDER